MSWWSIPAFAMLVLGAGCGRVGFASQGDAGDGDASARDASLPPAVGELDPSFGQDGVTTVSSAGAEVVMWDILERPGGYLAHGYHRVPGTATSFAFLGLTESGQPDATYQSTPGEPGVLRFGLGTNHFGYALTRLGADRLAVAGDGNMGTSDNVIAGIVDERGVPDPTFGFRQVDLEGADLGDTAHAVTSIGDDVLVCGTQDYPATDSHLALLRLGPTGQLVSSWGFGGLTLDDLSAASTDACVDIVRHGTGVVVFAAIGAGMGLVRYLASGLRDSAFGAGGVVTVIPSGSGHTVVEVDGDLVAGGVEGGDGVLA